jgi:hypothetical protein
VLPRPIRSTWENAQSSGADREAEHEDCMGASMFLVARVFACAARVFACV